jgi:hypothetical protein
MQIYKKEEKTKTFSRVHQRNHLNLKSMFASNQTTSPNLFRISNFIVYLPGEKITLIKCVFIQTMMDVLSFHTHNFSLNKKKVMVSINAQNNTREAVMSKFERNKDFANRPQ